ncbi:MAG: hypothetical protein HYR55_10255 [Acidobacteria bacterium]|nr:hypothetical protein [Acidobacteriota bacterium]MBI3658606.1 hypothetical protein [Acidobacteriota bacterium]
MKLNRWRYVIVILALVLCLCLRIFAQAPPAADSSKESKPPSSNNTKAMDASMGTPATVSEAGKPTSLPPPTGKTVVPKPGSPVIQTPFGMVTPTVPKISPAPPNEASAPDRQALPQESRGKADVQPRDETIPGNLPAPAAPVVDSKEKSKKKALANSSRRHSSSIPAGDLFGQPTGSKKAPRTNFPAETTELPTNPAGIIPTNYEWLETASGEVVTVNAAAQRLLIRDERTRRTKLINFNRDTQFKKGEETVTSSLLRIGTLLTIKYDFLDSIARLIILEPNPPAVGK